jgi:hypothetical protein
MMNNVHPLFQQLLKPLCPETFDGFYQNPGDGVYVSINGHSVSFSDHGTYSTIIMTEKELAEYVPKLKRL